MERSWGQAKGQTREFKWRGKAEMRDVCRASIIRSAFIVSFGIGLPALPAAPIDKVDKCTHRTHFVAEEDGRLWMMTGSLCPSFARFISKTRINQRRDKLH